MITKRNGRSSIAGPGRMRASAHPRAPSAAGARPPFAGRRGRPPACCRVHSRLVRLADGREAVPALVLDALEAVLLPAARGARRQPPVRCGGRSCGYGPEPVEQGAASVRSRRLRRWWWEPPGAPAVVCPVPPRPSPRALCARAVARAHLLCLIISSRSMSLRICSGSSSSSSFLLTAHELRWRAKEGGTASVGRVEKAATAPAAAAHGSSSAPVPAPSVGPGPFQHPLAARRGRLCEVRRLWRLLAALLVAAVVVLILVLVLAARGRQLARVAALAAGGRGLLLGLLLRLGLLLGTLALAGRLFLLRIGVAGWQHARCCRLAGCGERVAAAAASRAAACAAACAAGAARQIGPRGAHAGAGRCMKNKMG